MGCFDNGNAAVSSETNPWMSLFHGFLNEVLHNNSQRRTSPKPNTSDICSSICTCISLELNLHVTNLPSYPQINRHSAASPILHSAPSPHPCTTNAHASRALPERRDQQCLQVALLCGYRQPHLVRDSMERLCNWLYTTVCELVDVVLE